MLDKWIAQKLAKARISADLSLGLAKLEARVTALEERLTIRRKKKDE